MKITTLDGIVLKIAILAMPFELFGLPVGETYLAPSYVVQFLFLFTIIFYLRKKIHNLYILFSFVFLIIANGFFTYQQLDINRYVINSLTLFSLFLLCVKNYILRLKISQHNYFTIFKYSIFICAFFVYLQFIIQYLLGFNFLFGIERYTLLGRSFTALTTRYQGFMVEPSYAGYIIASLLTYEVFVFLTLNQFLSFQAICKKLMQIAFLTGAILLTASTHIFTVITALSLVLLIRYKKAIKYVMLNSLKMIKTFFLFCLIVTIVVATFASNLDIQHYVDRTTLSNDNISALAWIRGYENANTSLKINPLFGFGLGNNYRAFNYSGTESTAQNQLDKYSLSELTKNDSFSLLFRLLSEGGLTITLYFLFFIVFLIAKNINKANGAYYPFSILYSIRKRQDKQNIFNYESKKFLYIPFLVAVLGALLKEPTYYNYIIPITILFL